MSIFAAEPIKHVLINNIIMRIFPRVLSAIALTITFVASAVPARQIERIMTQPDGTTVLLTLKGDEFYHFYVTNDGQMVLRNDDGAYMFAEVNAEGKLSPSKVQASDAANRTQAQRTFLNSISRENITEAIRSTAANSPRMARAPMSNKAPAQRVGPTTNQSAGIGLFSSASFPTTGSPHACIILVEYQDVKFKTSYATSAKNYFTNMLTQRGFNESGGTGSALDYFSDASNGKFTPSFDVYGPITLENNRSYYGGNDAIGDDLNPADMALEACRQLNSTVDFTQYDTNNDTFIDHVFIIYAGEGEASGGPDDSVWPHAWNVGAATGNYYIFDGVKLAEYGCTCEWDGIYNKPDGVGTFCHEFSHILGLPDEYDIDYGNAENLTPGIYSVMDQGPYNNNSRTPPTYSIVQRNALNWADVTVIEREVPATISLEHILTSHNGCIIQTSSKEEFFMLENRQQSGWDAYIPGHGLLIWHVKYVKSYWDNNEPNADASHLYLDIEEAGGSANNKNLTTLAKYPFPGTANKTSFTDTTSPNMKTWSGTKLNTPITNITESNGTITFDVCGGIDKVLAPSADNKGGTYNNAIAVTLTPQNAEDEIHYTLNVDGQATVSATYTSPINISDNATLEFYSSRNGETSATTSYTYSFATADPTLTQGGTFSELPEVTMTSATTDATIYYTVDGTTPTTSSSVYSGAVAITCAEGEKVIVKAIAKRGKWAESAVVSQTYTLRGGNATGIYERISNLNDLADGDKIIITNRDASNAMGIIGSTTALSYSPIVGITLTDEKIHNPASNIWIITLEATETAGKYYLHTDDGYLAAGTSNENKFRVNEEKSAHSIVTIVFSGDNAKVTFSETSYSKNILQYNASSPRFSCYASGQQDVAIFREMYSSTVTPTVETPTFTPADGTTLASGETFAIACATDGATIHYTLDGSTPDATSEVYTEAIALEVEADTDITVKAIAIKEGANNSSVATATYHVTAPESPDDPIEPDEPITLTVSDYINFTTTGISKAETNYYSYNNKTYVSDAAYALQCASQYSSIQIRSKNSNSGIVSTGSGGYLRKVTLTWNSNTSSARQVDIYGKNEPYNSPSDLYSTSTKGTKLGSISRSSSPNSLEITGEYKYIGLRSKSDALYLDDIEIVWERPVESPEFYVEPTTLHHAADKSVTLTCQVEHSNYSDVQQYEVWVVKLPEGTNLEKHYIPTTADVVGSAVQTEFNDNQFNVDIPLSGLSSNAIHSVVIRAQAVLINGKRIDSPSGEGFNIEGSTGEIPLTVDTTLSDQTTGVEDVDIDSNCTPEYYNLQGIRVNAPTPGIYIMRVGTTTQKVVIK